MQGLLDAVVDVARELSLPVTLRRIAQAASQLVDAEYGALGVIGEAGEITELIHVGFAEGVPAMIGRLPLGRGLIGESLRNPRPLRVPDVTRHPAAVGFPPGHPRFDTFLNVPIMVRGEAFGTLVPRGEARRWRVHLGGRESGQRAGRRGRLRDRERPPVRGDAAPPGLAGRQR